MKYEVSFDGKKEIVYGRLPFAAQAFRINKMFADTRYAVDFSEFELIAKDGEFKSVYKTKSGKVTFKLECKAAFNDGAKWAKEVHKRGDDNFYNVHADGFGTEMDITCGRLNFNDEVRRLLHVSAVKIPMYKKNSDDKIAAFIDGAWNEFKAIYNAPESTPDSLAVSMGYFWYCRALESDSSWRGFGDTDYVKFCNALVNANSPAIPTFETERETEAFFNGAFDEALGHK